MRSWESVRPPETRRRAVPRSHGPSEGTTNGQGVNFALTSGGGMPDAAAGCGRVGLVVGRVPALWSVGSQPCGRSGPGGWCGCPTAAGRSCLPVTWGIGAHGPPGPRSPWPPGVSGLMGTRDVAAPSYRRSQPARPQRALALMATWASELAATGASGARGSSTEPGGSPSMTERKHISHCRTLKLDEPWPAPSLTSSRPPCSAFSIRQKVRHVNFKHDSQGRAGR